LSIVKKTYRSWLAELKNSIQQSKLHTALQVNSNMLILYWYIGRQIDEKIRKESWGQKVIEQLSADLQKSFPDLKGFSSRNLLYMQQFSAAYPGLLILQQPAAKLKSNGKKSITQQPAAQLGKIKRNTSNVITQQPVAQLGKIKRNTSNVITQQPVAQLEQYCLNNPHSHIASIPWGHHTLLMDKVAPLEERVWYIQKTIENNWSRAVLQYQIESGLYDRQHKTKKTTNFHLTLPKAQSDLANQILKDPYKFEFLQVSEKITERQLEQQLVDHIQEFLIELGAGFAYVGKQFKLKAGRKDHYLDLLFYHLHLRCFIVIELKLEDFELSHVGQMNGYLNMVNKQLKQKADNPSIGIILCGSKDAVEVDYALMGIEHPIGVSEYRYMKTLPKQLKDKLPSVKQLQNEVKLFLKKQRRGKR
jgi:predicted nuclease of restriction endonuclease-like (RecB) superfamily